MLRIEYLAVFAFAGLSGACSPRNTMSETSGEEPAAAESGGPQTTTGGPEDTGPPPDLPHDSSSSGGGTTTTGTTSSSRDDESTSGDSTTLSRETGDPPYPECGCDPVVSVGYREAVDGRTPEQALTAMSPITMPLIWDSIESEPPATTVTFTLTYEGGEILSGPGGSNGCAFLADTCPPGFEIPVAVHTITDDGHLDAVFAGTASIPAIGDGSYIIFGTRTLPIAAVSGTLVDEVVLDPNGDPLTLATVQVKQVTYADSPGDLLYMAGAAKDGTETAIAYSL